MTTIEDYELIKDLALMDVGTLKEKGMYYGDSWKKRGGVGAFMMLARKWDRIENMARAYGWDCFTAANERIPGSDILEEIADLRRYLFLVEAHVLTTEREQPKGYVNQDR